MGLQLLILDLSDEKEIDAAVTTAIQNGTGALFAGGGAFMNSQRGRLVALAARHKIPASFGLREASSPVWREGCSASRSAGR